MLRLVDRQNQTISGAAISSNRVELLQAQGAKPSRFVRYAKPGINGKKSRRTVEIAR
jgi:hypothetical protein